MARALMSVRAKGVNGTEYISQYESGRSTLLKTKPGNGSDHNSSHPSEHRILAGHLLTETNTAGLLTNLAVANPYDSLGRRMSLSLNAKACAVNFSYGYDLASRLSGVTNGNVNAAYNYLANSPLVEQLISRQNGTTRMTTTKSYESESADPHFIRAIRVIRVTERLKTGQR